MAKIFGIVLEDWEPCQTRHTHTYLKVDVPKKTVLGASEKVAELG